MSSIYKKMPKPEREVARYLKKRDLWWVFEFAISVASFATSLNDPPLGAFLQKISAYGYFIWTLIPTYLFWSLVKSSNSR